MTLLAEYIINKKKTYEIGYAMKTRSPNLYERYTWSTWMMAANMNNTYGDGNGYVGNINLKPETAHTISFSSDWHDEAKTNWSLKATPYFTYVKDYIDAIECTEIGKSCMSRSDGFSTLSLDNQTARIYGFDLSGYQSLTKLKKYGEIVLKGSFSISRGKNTDASDNLYRVMPANSRLLLEQNIDNGKMKAKVLKAQFNEMCLGGMILDMNRVNLYSGIYQMNGIEISQHGVNIQSEVGLPIVLNSATIYGPGYMELTTPADFIPFAHPFLPRKTITPVTAIYSQIGNVILAIFLCISNILDMALT